jgi:hypothetical protein
MGEFSKILNDKSEEELNEIFNSISTYTGEFIDDYLAELDMRRILWDMKILLKEKDLITITIKLESISNSKYLNLLKRELEIRGLKEKYEQEKNGFVKDDNGKSTHNKESLWTSIGSFGGFILLIVFLIKKFIPADHADNEQKTYSPINQLPEQSYDINYPQNTIPQTPTIRPPFSFDSNYELKNLSVEKYKTLDSNTIRILQEIDKSQNTGFGVNQNPTYLDLKNQIDDKNINKFESNPFPKINRSTFKAEKWNSTTENSEIDTNSKQAPTLN